MATQNSGWGQARLTELLAGVRRLFFIGIGGVHMSTLALMAHWRGLFVAGSDRAENENTARVRRAGIPVFIGHDAAHLAGAQAVVYTLAVGPENPEYAAAAEAGLTPRQLRFLHGDGQTLVRFRLCELWEKICAHFR